MGSRFVEFFGPCMWKTLHSISFTYPHNAPPHVQKQYVDFFEAVGNVIPCPSCGKHYRDYKAAHPITATEDRASLAKWVLDLHNDVNRRTGKREYSFEEVEAVYGKWDESNNAHLRSMSKPQRNEYLASPRVFNNYTPDFELPTPEPRATSQTIATQTYTTGIIVIAALLIAAGLIFSRKLFKR